MRGNRAFGTLHGTRIFANSMQTKRKRGQQIEHLGMRYYRSGRIEFWVAPVLSFELCCFSSSEAQETMLAEEQCCDFHSQILSSHNSQYHRLVYSTMDSRIQQIKRSQKKFRVFSGNDHRHRTPYFVVKLI